MGTGGVVRARIQPQVLPDPEPDFELKGSIWLPREQGLYPLEKDILHGALRFAPEGAYRDRILDVLTNDIIRHSPTVLSEEEEKLVYLKARELGGQEGEQKYVDLLVNSARNRIPYRTVDSFDRKEVLDEYARLNKYEEYGLRRKLDMMEPLSTLTQRVYEEEPLEILGTMLQPEKEKGDDTGSVASWLQKSHPELGQVKSVRRLHDQDGLRNEWRVRTDRGDCMLSLNESAQSITVSDGRGEVVGKYGIDSETKRHLEEPSGKVRIWSQKDIELRRDIMDVVTATYSGMVYNSAHKMRSNTLFFDDRVSAGFKGLLNGWNRFDVDEGTSFSTIAHPYIRAGIRVARLRQSGVIQLGARYQALATMLSHGHSPIEEDGSMVLHKQRSEPDTVKKMLRTIKETRTASLSTPIGKRKDTELGDMHPDRGVRPPDDAAVERLDAGRLTGEVSDYPPRLMDAMSRLNPKEQVILRLKSKGLSNDDISDIFDVTREGVRLNVKHIERKLVVAEQLFDLKEKLAKRMRVASNRKKDKLAASLRAEIMDLEAAWTFETIQRELQVIRGEKNNAKKKGDFFGAVGGERAAAAMKDTLESRVAEAGYLALSPRRLLDGRLVANEILNGGCNGVPSWEETSALFVSHYTEDWPQQEGPAYRALAKAYAPTANWLVRAGNGEAGPQQMTEDAKEMFDLAFKNYRFWWPITFEEHLTDTVNVHHRPKRRRIELAEAG